MSPSDFHPDLTSERLMFIGALIVGARNGAADTQKEKRGEGSWSLGCRAHERIIFAIEVAAKATPWLRVLDHTGLHFRFAIGSVPVGWYKGDPEQPHQRTLRRRNPEVRALQLAFDRDVMRTQPKEIAVRVAIETDENGRVDMLTLVVWGEDSNAILDSWQLYPLAAATSAPSAPATITPLQAAPKKLPPPPVEKRRKKSATSPSEPGTGTGDNG